MAGILRGDVVIPEEYVSDIIAATVQESAILTLARTVPISAYVTHLPVLSALPEAYWVNPADTGQKQTSQAAWEGKNITPEELAVIVPVPEAVVADANFDIFGYITPLIGAAMGKKLDFATLTGGDAPATFPANGILGLATTAGKLLQRGSVVDQDIAEDINQVMAMVEEQGFDVGGFAARPSLKAALRGLRNNIGGLLFQPSLQAGMEPTLYGETIMFPKNGGWDVTKIDLVAGDWDMSVLGIRQDINLKVLTEATLTDGAGKVLISLAEQDMIGLRCTMRIGFTLANPVTQLATDEATRSPFAALTPSATGGGPGAAPKSNGGTTTSAK
jgi:HK97 family phage major capsid protein